MSRNFIHSPLIGPEPNRRFSRRKLLTLRRKNRLTKMRENLPSLILMRSRRKRSFSLLQLTNIWGISSPSPRRICSGAGKTAHRSSYRCIHK